MCDEEAHFSHFAGDPCRWWRRGADRARKSIDATWALEVEARIEPSDAGVCSMAKVSWTGVHGTAILICPCGVVWGAYAAFWVPMQTDLW